MRALRQRFQRQDKQLHKGLCGVKRSRRIHDMLVEVLDVDVGVIISNECHCFGCMVDGLLGVPMLFDHEVTVMSLLFGPRQEV